MKHAKGSYGGRSFKRGGGGLDAVGTKGDKGIPPGIKCAKSKLSEKALDSPQLKGNRGVDLGGGSRIKHLGNSSKDAAKGD